MEPASELTRTWFLAAGDTDAEGRIPLPLVARRIIELATEHANALGIGYAALVQKGIGWVLSRMSIEMYSFPGINSFYTLRTWIESYNRRFSERNFEMTDADGNVIGRMRTVWAAIDFRRRTGADLSAVETVDIPISGRECPIDRTPRIPALAPNTAAAEYTFRYCDLDFNRHVNTLKYIELILDQWPLEQYDRYIPRRFDILFHHECLFGQTVTIRRNTEGGTSHIDIQHEGVRAVAAAIRWEERSPIAGE